MLTPSDYLRFRKRSTQCARCGASLVENAKNPSILVDPDEAEAPTEAIEPGTPQPVTDPQAETLQPEDKPSREGKSGESSTPEKAGKEDEDHGFDRFDYCDICWDDIKEKAFFSFWIGRRPEKAQPARKLNRQERNMALVA
ncbi:hypothetical protein HQ520_12540, partial [bacterium]|nr:hypothetical protein [bacterium]